MDEDLKILIKIFDLIWINVLLKSHVISEVWIRWGGQTSSSVIFFQKMDRDFQCRLLHLILS